MSGVDNLLTSNRPRHAALLYAAQGSRVLATGAGGFIGHHLVKRLTADGHWVHGVNLKEPEYEPSTADEFELLDLRKFDNCLQATRGRIDHIYNLAADMGGIGYITASHADISHSNILINAPHARGQRAEWSVPVRFLIIGMRVCPVQAAAPGGRCSSRRSYLFISKQWHRRFSLESALATVGAVPAGSYPAGRALLRLRGLHKVGRQIVTDPAQLHRSLVAPAALLVGVTLVFLKLFIG